MGRQMTNDNSSISKEIHWFIQTLNKDFHVTVEAEQIGSEATELGLEEVDDAFIPTELFEIAPTTLLYEIMIIDDKGGNLWVGAIGFYPNQPSWCIQIILKNDVLMSRQLLSILD